MFYESHGMDIIGKNSGIWSDQNKILGNEVDWQKLCLLLYLQLTKLNQNAFNESFSKKNKYTQNKININTKYLHSYNIIKKIKPQIDNIDIFI